MQKKLFYVVTRNTIDYDLFHRFTGSVEDFPKLEDAENYASIKSDLIGVFTSKTEAESYKLLKHVIGRVVNYDWHETGYIQVKYMGYYYNIFPQILDYKKVKDKEIVLHNEKLIEVNKVHKPELRFRADNHILEK